MNNNTSKVMTTCRAQCSTFLHLTLTLLFPFAAPKFDQICDSETDPKQTEFCELLHPY